MVNPINNQAPVTPRTIGQPATQGAAGRGEKAASVSRSPMDTVSLSKGTDLPATYSASAISPDDLVNKGYEALRQLVTNMLKEQGIDFKIAIGEETVNISEITQEEAQELISDDGYFGVEQTSDRIVDFAIAMAGGDVSRLDAIKEGVEKGFNEALDAFGGWLPDISYDTYDTVMEKLDAWASGTEG